METASIEFVRHVSTTGQPAATSEGQIKPEIVLNTDALTAHATKLAAHTAVSYEVINDFEAFSQYAGAELYKQIIDVENLELLLGGLVEPGSPPTTPVTGMVGFYATPSILTHDCADDSGTNVTALDSVEKAIARLRTGPALAEADLLVLHPETWSAMRRIKSTIGEFLIAPDPTRDVASSLWDVDVLVTTQNPPGDGLLLDTSKFGYIGVRESLSMRVGYANDDLIRNLLRFVGEERLTLCVTRPPAILAISGLPTS
jgi:HK97 family phage major capsid protein